MLTLLACFLTTSYVSQWNNGPYLFQSPSVLITIIKQKVTATVVILRHALLLKDILPLKRGLCMRLIKIKLKNHLLKGKDGFNEENKTP